MSCLLDCLCNDVILIVYQILHRSQLNECFQEINTHLDWDDVEECYRLKPNDMGFRCSVANWRYPPSRFDNFVDEFIFNIWDSSTIEKGLLPKNYFFIYQLMDEEST